MIYLVRHGEAAASWGDHPDPGLSDAGQAQAKMTAERLVAMGARSPITSPMQRCRETALPFEELTGQAARLEAAVSEIVTPEGVEDRVAWLKSVMASTWPETLKAWREATFDAVNALPDQSVVFSHFVAINAVVSRISGDPRTVVFRPGHGSITQLERGADGKLQVAALGEEAATRIL